MGVGNQVIPVSVTPRDLGDDDGARAQGLRT